MIKAIRAKVKKTTKKHQSVKNKYQTVKEEVKKHWTVSLGNIKVDERRDGRKERGRVK